MVFHLRVAFALGFILLTVNVSARSEPPAEKPPQADLVDSATLKAELNKLIGEGLKAASMKGEPVPKEIDPKDPAAGFIQLVRKYDPKFLRVHPDVEKRWKEGTFTDAAAMARMKSALQVLTDFKVALPRLHTQLIGEYKAETLNGARLELAAQLLEAEVAKVKKALQDG